MRNCQTESLDHSACDFYCQALKILHQAGIPVLIGGTHAFAQYTGIQRNTKDLDLFARPSDVSRILEVFAAAGYETEMAVSHWLAKAHCQNDFVDIIFNSAHGRLPVDDSWFDHAIEEQMFGIPVKICAPEEIIWSKAYVMARDRFDGADIAHLILTYGDRLDWQRLVTQFGEHWRVLLSHLVLFGLIYPGQRSRIPTWVIQRLSQQLAQESHQPDTGEKLCQGTLLSPLQYRIDIEQWGYEDARLTPRGSLTPADVGEWMDHLQQEKGILSSPLPG
ncbi:nucleotidyltransferase [Pantanalinema sp. GBBB05]|uniref:nucleotidyltransferase n=1 Tax=Pantanalinema sp. GBBB05 TaxID=2604139 RepID=UPI001D2E0D9F|nr:hypothetical protein [Pantanalinema sp. GBBB05]